jgi:hypothetical protein
MAATCSRSLAQRRKRRHETHTGPRPAELTLVNTFLNAWRADGPHERLESPEYKRDWLAKGSFLPPSSRVSRRIHSCACRPGLLTDSAERGCRAKPLNQSITSATTSKSSQCCQYTVRLEQTLTPLLQFAVAYSSHPTSTLDARIEVLRDRHSRPGRTESVGILNRHSLGLSAKGGSQQSDPRSL